MTRVRRVVLAIDRGDRTARLVREAVSVASCLGVELEGLFVEDDALLRLAGHEFARRFGVLGEAQALSPADLEAEWRAIAREVRGALEREAERHRLAARFAVARGAVELALRERLAGGDLVLVGWAGWSPAVEPRRVRVLYDDDGESERAIELGVRLAGPDGALSVWIAPDGERAERLADHVRQRVGGRTRLCVAGVSDAAPATLRRALADEPGGLLIVPAEHELALRLAHRSVAARFACSVLVASAEPRIHVTAPDDR